MAGRRLDEAPVFLLWDSVVGETGPEPTELPTSQNLADDKKPESNPAFRFCVLDAVHCLTTNMH